MLQKYLNKLEYDYFREKLSYEIANGTYINGFGTTWSDMIETHTWKVGGISFYDLLIGTLKTTYNYELGSSSSSATYNAKIGLMYVSDYGYAASPANWTTTLFDYANDTNRNNNWMFMGLYEWTNSRISDRTNVAFRVYGTGNVDYGNSVYGNFGVRPSFYLKSNVAITSGDGSSTNPYRLTLA